MHEIRRALRGRGVVLMGKNTMVRRAIRVLASEFPEYERLLPAVKGTIPPISKLQCAQNADCFL